MPEISRRNVLAIGAAAALASATTLGDGLPAVAAPLQSPLPDQLRVTVVEGTDIEVSFQDGAAGVLLYALQRLSLETDLVAPGEVVTALNCDATLGRWAPHVAAGTGFLVRPDAYPRGRRGNLFESELAVVSDILAEFEGVIAWGGDSRRLPWEALYYLAAPGSSQARGRLAQLDEVAGASVGTIDAFQPERRQKARKR